MRTAWLVVFLLMPVALLNYLDRQMLAAMKSSVMADITSIENDAHWGYMLGQFKWVYAILSPFAGLVADRVGRRLTICSSLFVWSAVTWWTGRATSYDELLTTRSLMGISEAFYIPAALALIADHHSTATRSRAVGLHQMGIYLGVIAGGFAGFVSQHPALGWRSAFTACGVVGMVYTVPLMMLLKRTGRPPSESPSTLPELAGGNVVKQLILNPSFLLLVLYFTLPAMAGWVVRDWMPAILKDKFDLNEGYAGMWATVPAQVLSMVGAVIGGYLADLWMRRSQRGRIYVSALGMLCIVPAIFGVGNSQTLAFAVGFLMLFGLGWGFFDGNNMPILSQIVPARMRATGYGIMNFVSISCGGLADYGFGVLRDRKVELNLIFGAFAGVALLSAVLVLLIRPRAELS